MYELIIKQTFKMKDNRKTFGTKSIKKEFEDEKTLIEYLMSLYQTTTIKQKMRCDFKDWYTNDTVQINELIRNPINLPLIIKGK